MDSRAVRPAGGARPKSTTGRPVRARPAGATSGQGQAQALSIPDDLEAHVREWLAVVTLHFRVQWSEVWGLPVWLWLQYVEGCEAILKHQREVAQRV